MINILITLAVGCFGGLLAYKFKMPAGPMLGAMIAVGIYNCLGFVSYMPEEMRIGVQIVMGCVLGLRLNRETFKQLKTVIKPALIIIPSLMLFGLTTGFILFYIFKLDVYTAFLSSTPGGLAELSLLAATLGGDGPRVAILHTLRLITVISVTPIILHFLARRKKKITQEQNQQTGSEV